MRNLSWITGGAGPLLMLLLTGCAGGAASTAPTAAPSQPAAAGQPATSAPVTAAPAKRYPAPLPADKQVTIVFENYNLASAGIGRDATLQMIEEFQQAHPNIKVEGKGTDSQKIMASIQAQIAAGNPPDVAQLLLREWDIAVDNLNPLVLEDLVPPDELAAHLAGIHPRAMKLTERKGQHQGMPYVFSTPTLFYNADLFRAAGLDPEKPPATWAEVKEYGLRIKAATSKDAIYIACIDLDWCAQAVLLSNGGRFLSDDRSKVQFGEPAAVEALAMWQDLIAAGIHPKLGDADGQDAFKSGNVAMYLQTSAVQASLLKAAEGKWTLKAAGMPSFGTRPAVPTNSGSGLGILATTPDKQRAAWELVKFLTSERAFTIITEKIGYLPLRPAIVHDERYLKGWIAQNPQILPNLAQMDYLEPSVSFPGPNHVQIRDIYLKAQRQVLFNGADPAPTMREAQTRATELLPKS